MSEEITFKVCIFGDSGVGKTALVKRYMMGIFDPEYKITVGVDFHTKKLDVEGKNVSLQIWDFAGEAQFKFLLPSYIRGAAGGVFMYDITRKSSLTNVAEWLTIVNSSIRQESDKFPILLVGGKSDLEDYREVSQEAATEALNKFELLNWFECSSKTGQDVERIFIEISHEMMKRANLL